MTFEVKLALSLWIAGAAVWLKLTPYRTRPYAYFAVLGPVAPLIRYVVLPVTLGVIYVVWWCCIMVRELIVPHRLYGRWPQVRTVLAAFGLAICLTGTIARIVMPLS